MSIEERLVSLERANRCYRWGIAGLLLAIVGFSVWHESELPAAPVEEKITKILNVETLNIMGSDGKVAAFLSGGKGTVIFKMGPVGQGVGLSMNPDGSSVFSLDDGEHGLILGPSSVSFSRRPASAVKDRERTLWRFASGEKGIPVDDLTRAFSSPPGAVVIETSETGGGILLRNQFGKDAVSVQVNKSNIGAIY